MCYAELQIFTCGHNDTAHYSCNKLHCDRCTFLEVSDWDLCEGCEGFEEEEEGSGEREIILRAVIEG